MKPIPDARNSLSRSKFRTSFRLTKKDIEYINKKGLSGIEVHARDFIVARLEPARPEKDGRQTPLKGHPVFKAQHATATCCRNCLRKWYNIPKGRRLSADEIGFIVDVIMVWIRKEYDQFREGKINKVKIH